MHIITYSLKADQPRSDSYYRDIAAFTDTVLEHSEPDCRPLVATFQDYLQQTGRETPRTWPEYLFELLTLGMLWRVYTDRALTLNSLPRRTLTTLVRARQRGGRLKPVVDVARGALSTLFLARNGQNAATNRPLNLDGLERLLAWLAASGEFDPEVKRLGAWRDYFSGLAQEDTQRDLATIIDMADWFAERSLDVLGIYTPHVETFLKETYPGYRWREDMIFCGRQRVEYHLNMVGTEIMNRAFRAGFLGTAHKVVLVPPCMRARTADRCEARPTPIGDQCAGCEPGCRVHQVTKLGEKHGFAVFMLPRELAALAPSQSTQDRMSGMGVVGVSCPLTNPQGGWKTRDMNLPAQGLLLDYCGCSWHWHLDGGIPTAINLNELLRVLDIPTKSPKPAGESPALAPVQLE